MDIKSSLSELKLNLGGLTSRTSLFEELKAKDFHQSIKHRNILVYWVIAIVSVWLLIVSSILFLQGTSCVQLSDAVLITLLSTTTINILGLPLIILKGLFNKKDE